MHKINEPIDVDIIDKAKVTETQNDVDWQSNCKTAKERLSYLLHNGSLSDCKFVVGQKTYPAHKLILASASREFETMFYGESAENKDVFVINDVRPEVFEAMLVYIYTDVIDAKTFHETLLLCFCAKKFKLKYLSTSCIHYLTVNLNEHNVCHTYEFAKFFHDYDLQENCMQYIQIHATNVFKGVSFRTAKWTTVKEIFSFSHMNYNNEVEIFEAAVRYANAIDELKPNVETSRKRKLPPNEPIAETSDGKTMDAEKKEPTTSYNDLSQGNAFDISTIDNKKKIRFRKICPHILFLTMTPQQFAEKISQSLYLTESEKYALLINIVSDKTKIPIPDGFSCSRIPRFKLITDPSCNTDLSTTKTSNRTEAVFKVTFSEFRTQKQMSLPFCVRNMKLHVAIDPLINTYKVSKEELLIQLVSPSLEKRKITCTAECQIGVAKQKNGNSQNMFYNQTHVFSPQHDSVNYTIRLTDEIFDINSDYVKDNSIAILVKIKTKEMTDN